MIEKQSRVFFAAAVLLLCTGCPEESSTAPESAPAPASTEAVDEADAALLEGIDLSGEDAADAITEENADAEFDKLLQEISNDG